MIECIIRYLKIYKVFYHERNCREDSIKIWVEKKEMINNVVNKQLNKRVIELKNELERVESESKKMFMSEIYKMKNGLRK